MSEPLRLRIALGNHDHVAPLRDGRVTSDRVVLDLIPFDPLPRAFRAMARGDTLDVSEMAVVTHLLAHHFGKPITGIAIPLWSRLPHTNLICPANADLSAPADLAGRNVGVRAYSQTSGVWVRGILASEYGVDLDSITWGTMEDAHVAEYRDPPNTHRHLPPPGLRDLMLQGAFAAIMGERIIDPSGIRTVIPEAAAAASTWMARTGIVPINHIVSVRSALVAAHPWLPAELMVMFERARAMTGLTSEAGSPDYGLASSHASLQRCLDDAADQRVTPRRYLVEELFLDL